MEHLKTTPASKFLIGSQIEDLRERVSLAPLVIAETLDMVYSTPPNITKKLVGGRYQNVYTYKRKGNSEASFMSLSNKVDIPAILETAKKIADYADKNGTMKETADGFLTEVEINDYLKHLGYTPQDDGSYQTKDRRKVWQDLKQVFSTPVKRAVSFKSGDTLKTLVFEAPIIHYAEIYPSGDTKKALTIQSDNPPQSFLVGIVPEVAKQMTGFKEGGFYFHRNLIAEPRRKAVDFKHDLTGYKLPLQNRLFVLFRTKVAPIRRYTVKSLTEVISGRSKDRVKKLRVALDLFEKRGDIKEWGFCDSRNKSYTKKQGKSRLVWVDHTETAVFRKYQEFYKAKKSDIAKEREDIKRLSKEVRRHGKEITKIKKDL